MSLRGLWRPLLLAAIGAAMGSCHHGFSPSGDPCADYGAAKCARMDECGLTALFELGDADTCAPRLALWCQAHQGIPGSGFTRDKLEACASEIGDLDCGTLRTSWLEQIEVGPACGQLMKGTLPAGSPCTLGLSCESGGCIVGELGPCGTCAPIGHDGDDCRNAVFGCVDGLTCDISTLRCAPYTLSSSGGPCGDALHACDVDLRCVEGACQSMLEEGDLCDNAPDDCDANQQLACDPVTGRCARQDIEEKQIGETCNTSGVAMNPVKLAACAAGSTCRGGVCVATAPDGGSCSAGKPCMYPYSCDPEGNLCALPDWPTCQ